MRVATLLLGLLATQVGAEAPAQAYVRAIVNSRPGVYLYWRSRQVSYWVNQDGYSNLSQAAVAGAIRRSFSTWSGPSCTDFSFVFEGLTDISKTNLTRDRDERPDGRNVVRWREDAWPPEGASDSTITEDWLALTVLVYNVRTGELLDADMDLNGVNFDWTVSDSAPEIATDVQNVVTHEVGHVIGLGHSELLVATMHAEQPQGETSKRVLHPDDEAGLCEIYPFSRPTPLGPDQPLPDLELVGTNGCRVGPKGAEPGPTPAAGSTLPVALFGVLLALAWGRGRGRARRRR